MWRRFDVRLLVIILIITSSLALTLTLYNGYQTSSALQELATSSYQQLAQVEASKIRDLLLNRRLDVLFVSQAASLRRFANAPNPHLSTEIVTQYLMSYLRLNRDRYSAACLLDDTGYELVCVDNVDGQLAIIPSNQLESRQEAPYFINALTTFSVTGAGVPVYISPPLIHTRNDHSERAALVMSTRLQSDTGLTVGVITLEMSLDNIDKLLFNDMNVRSFLVDNEGRYVLTPQGGFKEAMPLFADEHPHAADYILKRTEGVYLDEQHQLLQVFARVRPTGQSSIQWTLISEIPLAVVLAPVQQSQRASFALSLGLVGAFGVVSWLVARRITVPLRQLTLLAEHIQSDLGTPAPTLRHGTQEMYLLEIALRQLDTRVQNLLNTEKDRVIELERAQAVLEESEARFRTMANSAPALIWLSNASQAPIYFNQTWLNFTGRTLDEELNVHWSHDIHPEDRARAEQIYKNAFERHEAFQMEYRRRLHDGRYSWMKDQALPRFSSDGLFEGYVGICFDISDIKQAQLFLTDMSRELELRVQERTEALSIINAQLQDEIKLRERAELEIREQATLLQMLTDFASDLICLHSIDGTYEFVSPSASTLLGYSPESLIGRNPYDFFHPEDISARISESHRIALEERRSTNIIYRYRTASGQYIWLETATEPVINDKGQVHHIVTVSRDVTEQRMQQQRLKESERFLHGILNGQTSQIIVLDESGTMIEANQAWRDEADNTQDNPLIVWQAGLNYLNVCETAAQTGNETARAVLKGIHQVMRGESSIFAYEYHFQSEARNQWYMLQVNSFPFGDEKRLLITHTEITAQKLIEMTVRASLEQEQRLNRLHAEFVSMVSHDFRTPLAAIMTTTDILMRYSERFTDTERAQRLMRIQSNVHHLNRLVDDIRYINDAEAKDIPLNLETVDLVDLTKPIVQDVEMAYEQPQTIEPHFALASPIFTTDPHLYHKIMNNLLSNALKYGQGKPVELSLSDANGHLKIDVRDYGIGIPLKEQNTIFSIFHRASNVGTIKGTGLGLVIVKQAVEALNGTITIESHEGEGTHIEVLLPRLS